MPLDLRIALGGGLAASNFIDAAQYLTKPHSEVPFVRI